MSTFDDHDTAVRQRAELRRDNWMIPLRNAREQLVASVKLIPLTEPRFAITGEDISPRDGWSVCNLRDESATIADYVDLKNIDGAVNRYSTAPRSKPCSASNPNRKENPNASE